jgi:hypothetical protein
MTQINFTKFLSAFFRMEKYTFLLDAEVTRTKGILLPYYPLTQPEEFIEDVNAFIIQLKELELPCTILKTEKLRKEVLRSIGDSRFVIHIQDLFLMKEIYTSMIKELSEKHIYYLTADQVVYYNNNNYWKKVIAKYPDLIFDINESGKCLALGLYTASIFHLMNIFTESIKIIAPRFNISDINVKTSNQLLNDMEEIVFKDLSLINKNYILMFLLNIRNGYCKNNMQLKDSYTEEDAVILYHLIKNFMTNLDDLQ